MSHQHYRWFQVSNRAFADLFYLLKGLKLESVSGWEYIERYPEVEVYVEKYSK